MNNDNTIIKFSVNSWNHLYSLKSAIERKQNAKGKFLTIIGNIRNNPLTAHQDTPILIEFINLNGTPKYQTSLSGNLILGNLDYINGQFQTLLSLDDDVFEELRKNLMEYTTIEGIHIIVSLELEGQPDIDGNQDMNIIDLQYAMKGDA